MTGCGRTSIATTAEVCARLVTGQTFDRIHKEMGVGRSSVLLARRVLERFGVEISRRPIAPVSEEVRQRATQLLTTTDLSDRAIAEQVGCSHGVVSRMRKAQLGPALRRGEEVPLCGCGEYLHHSRLCGFRVAAAEAEKGSPFAKLTKPQRTALKQRLLAGELTTTVADAFGLKVTAIRNFVQRLPAEERAERSRRLGTPGAQRRAASARRKVTNPRGTDPNSDPLYASIMAAIPKGVDPALADDAASDAYLALLEGTCDTKNLRAGVRRAVSSNYGRFANRFRDVSLDASRGPDTDDTLAGTIEDPRALAAFERL